jgi:hypothetical protein
VQLEHRVAFAHVIDGPGQLMSPDRQRLALAVCSLEASQVLWARRMVAEEPDCRCREGPREIRMADFRAGGAVACARRFLRTFDKSAIGHKILDLCEAGDVMNLVEPHQTQNLADAGDGLPPVEGLCLVLLGRLDKSQLHVVEQLIVGVNQGEIDFDMLLHGGIKAPFRHAIPIRLVGQLLPELGQVVLAVRMLDVREERGAFARQMQTAPEEVPGGAPVSRIDVGLGEHAAAEQHRHLMRVDFIVFGLVPVDGLHRERVAQDERNTLAGAQVGQPVPGKNAFDTDDQISPVGGNGVEEWFWASGHVAVEQNLSLLVKIHRYMVRACRSIPP